MNWFEACRCRIGTVPPLGTSSRQKCAPVFGGARHGTQRLVQRLAHGLLFVDRRQRTEFGLELREGTSFAEVLADHAFELFYGLGRSDGPQRCIACDLNLVDHRGSPCRVFVMVKVLE